MNTPHFHFQPLPAGEMDPLITHRAGETKLGEALAADWREEACRYVLLGICEDVGARANNGLAGARNGWDAFLPNFLNLQANRFITPGGVHVLGRIDQQDSDAELDATTMRERVAELDDLVLRTVLPILQAGKVPLVIGGGHNNAYPLIQAASQVQGSAVDVVNLDPHADCRPLEGRHSGNSFSYGIVNGFIRRYAVFALHRARNSEAILQFMDDHDVYHTFYAEYLMDPTLFHKDLSAYIEAENTPLCVELDKDVIRHMPSSAFSPSGMVLEEARYYLRRIMGSTRPVLYVHLPEAAPNTPSQGRIVGKALAFLVHDVISVRR
ncbi:MAG: arginase family protein [Flavobacteriales bacterium]|nr:arginase family protein [Flavobacteriales bacterium]